MMIEKISLPQAVIDRLPHYYVTVKDMMGFNEDSINSEKIAKLLGVSGSTVRQDFRLIGIKGKSNVGYSVTRLLYIFERILGIEKNKRVVIVGAGNIGKALALHGKLRNYGFHVRAIVDKDKSLVGRRVGNLKIRHISELSTIIAREKIDIGVIAVPKENAQRVADMLVRNGIKGIVNLSFATLHVPSCVSTVNARFVFSFLKVSALMTGRLKII